MINLLSDNARATIRYIYLMRVVTVWAWLLITAGGVILLSLLPTYVLIAGQISLYETGVTEASEKIANHQTAAAALVQSSLRASWIVSNNFSDSLSTAIIQIESVAGSTITLSGLQIGRSMDGVISPLTVSGTAATRQALLQFRDALEALPLVESVELPFTNLAEREAVPFSLRVTMKSTTE